MIYGPGSIDYSIHDVSIGTSFERLPTVLPVHSIIIEFFLRSSAPPRLVRDGIGGCCCLSIISVCVVLPLALQLKYSSDVHSGPKQRINHNYYRETVFELQSIARSLTPVEPTNLPGLWATGLPTLLGSHAMRCGCC